MIKLRIALAAAAAAVFAMLGFAPAAQAYPDVTCTIEDPGETCEGEPLTLTATVDPDVNCSPISITWNGMTRQGTGSSFQATFPTEEGDADRDELETSEVSCTYIDGSGASQTVSAQGVISIEECDDDDDSDDSDGDDSDDSDDNDDDGNGLPDTGGERLLWLLLGLLLIAGGAVVIATSGREDEAQT